MRLYFIVHLSRRPKKCERETTAPTIAPICTIGPSLPRGRAVETTSVIPEGGGSVHFRKKRIEAIRLQIHTHA